MSTNTACRFSNNQAYWPLTRSYPSQSHQKSLLKNRLNHVFQSLFAQMTNSSEPRVWKSKDKTGHTLWNAYDGAFDRVIRNASETELREWLEHRYQL